MTDPDGHRADGAASGPAGGAASGPAGGGEDAGRRGGGASGPAGGVRDDPPRAGRTPDAAGRDPAAGPPVPLNPREPQDPFAGAEAEPPPRPVGRARRFWAARRVPAGITALLVLGGGGLLLYDVAAVRAGRQAMAWRVTVARELARRPLDDVWVLAGAAVATALGLWLLSLAVTPGLRQVLPMRPGPGRIRAGLDRDAAALVLRDAALEVQGVQSVRVAVGRRRAKVRVESHFRALDDVRDDLDTVLGDTRRGLGLQRPPRLSLAVRRAGKG